MRKNIGILTFHASHNYGSMLQAYALQTYLSTLGHTVKVINIRPEDQKRLYEHPFKNILKSKRALAKAILKPGLFIQDIIQWNKFESFLSDYLNLTSKEYKSYTEIEKDLDRLALDVMITGGDQIWNLLCCDFDLSFVLPFNRSQIKKISYAPSMGRETKYMKEPPYVHIFKKYVASYDVISTREPDSAQFLSELLNRNVRVVADPVFLLTKQQYEHIINDEPIINGRYFFYYTPSKLYAPGAFESASEYAKSRKLKLVSANAGFRQKDVVKKNSSGPLEFLNLLFHAEFVCGTSFHLAVFSLLFHKDFAIFNGNKDPRMANILSECGIPNRGISLDKPDFSKMEKIDYSKVDTIIQKLKNDAEEFLNSALLF